MRAIRQTFRKQSILTYLHPKISSRTRQVLFPSLQMRALRQFSDNAGKFRNTYRGKRVYVKPFNITGCDVNIVEKDGTVGFLETCLNLYSSFYSFF